MNKKLINGFIFLLVSVAIILGFLFMTYERAPAEINIAQTDLNDTTNENEIPFNEDNGQNQGEIQEIALQDYYLINFMDPFSESLEVIMELSKVNNQEYDFEFTILETFESEEEIHSRFSNIGMTMISLSYRFGPSLNRGFCLELYNYCLENNIPLNEIPQYIYDTIEIEQNIEEDISFENFYQILKKGFIKSMDKNIPEVNDSEEFLLAFEKIINSDIEVRNILISMTLIVTNVEIGKDEEYPLGSFSYFGDNKNAQLILCDISKNCVNLIDIDKELTHISDFFEMTAS